MVLAELVEHVALIYEEYSHTQCEEQYHPLYLHAHADKEVDSDGTNHADPCRATIGEEEADAESGKKQESQHTEPSALSAREDEIESGGQHQGNDAAVGCMIIVEGPHDAVQGLEVAEVAESLGGGDKNDHTETYGVGPEELAYTLMALE